MYNAKPLYMFGVVHCIFTVVVRRLSSCRCRDSAVRLSITAVRGASRQAQTHLGGEMLWSRAGRFAGDLLRGFPDERCARGGDLVVGKGDAYYAVAEGGDLVRLILHEQALVGDLDGRRDVCRFGRGAEQHVAVVGVQLVGYQLPHGIGPAVLGEVAEVVVLPARQIVAVVTDGAQPVGAARIDVIGGHIAQDSAVADDIRLLHDAQQVCRLHEIGIVVDGDLRDETLGYGVRRRFDVVDRVFAEKVFVVLPLDRGESLVGVGIGNAAVRQHDRVRLIAGVFGGKFDSLDYGSGVAVALRRAAAGCGHQADECEQRNCTFHISVKLICGVKVCKNSGRRKIYGEISIFLRINFGD